MRRRLYHDEDYAYDYTNQGDERWAKEKKARAQTCERFEPKSYSELLCKNCHGQKVLHRPQALLEKAS